MKIARVRALPVVGGWYCDDKAALSAGDVEVDYHLARGRPRTAGFTAVREVGRGVGIILNLEVGSSAHGDGASVNYAGAAGRDPPFRLEEHSKVLEKLRWRGARPHAATHYAISQALLEGTAAALRCTKAEVLVSSLGVEITESRVRKIDTPMALI